MKHIIIVACLVSMPYASVQCMDGEQQSQLEGASQQANQGINTAPDINALLMTGAIRYAESQINPPGYEANSEARIPQASDTYITYQDWWTINRVPVEIRGKRSIEQQAWVYEKNRQQKAEETKARKKKERDAKVEAYCEGFFLASLICFGLHL